MALPRLFRTYNSRQRGTLRAAGSYRCHWQHLNDTVLCACLEKGEESRKTFRVPAEYQDSTKFYMGAVTTPSSVVCILFWQKRCQQHCYSPFRVPLFEKGTPFTYFHKPPRISPSSLTCNNRNQLPMQPEPSGLGMKSPSHSQRYVPISFTHRPLIHIPVTEHSSISGNK